MRDQYLKDTAVSHLMEVISMFNGKESYSIQKKVEKMNEKKETATATGRSENEHH